MKIKEAHKRAPGFTLFELLATIAVLAILAAISTVLYTSQVQDSKRANCVAVLHEARHAMERYFAKNFDYNAEAGIDYPEKAPRDGSDVFCSITVTVLEGGQDYSITATPLGSLASDECGALTLTRVGVYSNSSGLPNEDCF